MNWYGYWWSPAVDTNGVGGSGVHGIEGGDR